METAGRVLLRTLLHPAEGVVGGDFLGTARAGEGVWFVIGDVAGHGLEAAVTALRLKDLVLSAVLVSYSDGVLRYANAGTCPAIWSTAAPAPPSGRWSPPGRCLAWSSIR